MIRKISFASVKRITLHVNDRTHMLLKLLSVFQGKPLNEITEEALTLYISSKSEQLKELLDANKNRLTIGTLGVALSALNPIFPLLIGESFGKSLSQSIASAYLLHSKPFLNYDQDKFISYIIHTK